MVFEFVFVIDTICISRSLTQGFPVSIFLNMSCIQNSVLSPRQPDVLLAKLDGEGGRVDVDVPPTLLRPLDCDHIVGSGQEVVVRFDQSWTRVGDEVEAGEVEQGSSEHDGAPLVTELSAGELLHFVYSGTM